MIRRSASCIASWSIVLNALMVDASLLVCSTSYYRKTLSLSIWDTSVVCTKLKLRERTITWCSTRRTSIADADIVNTSLLIGARRTIATNHERIRDTYTKMASLLRERTSIGWAGCANIWHTNIVDTFLLRITNNTCSTLSISVRNTN